jgi:HSP20 family protein
MFGSNKSLVKVGAPLRVSDAFGEMRSLMNQMFEGWDRGLPSVNFEQFPAGVAFAPKFELHETEAAVEISAELPGIAEKDVDVNVTRDALTIQGEKKVESRKEEKGALYTERSYGKFYRSMPLRWDIDREKVEATFKNGVLNVHMPKTTVAKNEARKVSIRQS